MLYISGPIYFTYRCQPIIQTLHYVFCGIYLYFFRAVGAVCRPPLSRCADSVEAGFGSVLGRSDPVGRPRTAYQAVIGLCRWPDRLAMGLALTEGRRGMKTGLAAILDRKAIWETPCWWRKEGTSEFRQVDGRKRRALFNT